VKDDGRSVERAVKSYGAVSIDNLIGTTEQNDEIESDLYPDLGLSRLNFWERR